MFNKTITGIIAITIIALALIFTKADPNFIYVCLALIASLCGVSIIKNNFHKKP